MPRNMIAYARSQIFITSVLHLFERSVCADRRPRSVERTTFAALDGARLAYPALLECFNVNTPMIRQS
jgi:hypothetical protein